ncbi:MAG: MFS transporter [Candidatus Nanohaloarchaea archaeon]
MDLDRVPNIAKYLSMIFLLSYFGRNVVWYFLPVFFERQIQSVFLIGLMTSLPAIVTIVLDIPVGNLVQRAGEKIVIFLGLLLNLFPGLFYLTGIPILLVFGKAFEGIVKSLVWNGGWTISLKSADEASESESTSVFLLGVNIAAVIGPIVGGYLIASKGFNLVFAIWVFAAWLGALIFYLYIGLEGEKGFIESLEDLFHRKTYVDDYRHLKRNFENLKFPMLLIMLYSIIFSFFWLAVPLLLERIGTNFQTMGLIFGLAALPKLFQFFFGKLGDSMGRLKLAGILSLLLAPVLYSMSLFSSIYLIGGLFLVARLFASGMSPLFHAFYDSRVPDELEGEMTGFLEFAKHSGQALGPAAAGAFASIGGIGLSFRFASVVSLLISVSVFYCLSFSS